MQGLIVGLALAAAHSTDLPKLGEPVGDITYWINNSDWTPSRAGGAVRVKVVFNPDGIPDTCIVQRTTGNKEVESLACEIVKKRFRFKPSSSSDGAPVNRVLVRVISISDKIPDSVRIADLFNITVNGYKKISHIFVVADVDKDGSLAGCSGIDRKVSSSMLAEVVCQNLKSLWKSLPEVDSTGAAIRYVRDIPVEIKHKSE